MERFSDIYARNFRELGRLYASEARLMKKGLDHAKTFQELNDVIISFTNIDEELIGIYDELIRIKKEFCWRR